MAILDALQEGVATFGDLLDVMTSGYSESYRKIRKKVYGSSSSPKGKLWSERYRESQRLYAFLSHLRREGFTRKAPKGEKRLPVLTKEGVAYLEYLRTRRSVRYQTKESGKLFVVVFDIRETEKKKREWIREVLRNLGYAKLQGSVWIGGNEVPEEFIKDLSEEGILDCVHIFEVKKKGTISSFFGELEE